MFPREKVVAACLVLSLLGLSALYLHAESITPRDLEIGDLGAGDVGTQVRVRGHVHRVGTTEEGNAAIALVDYRDFATIRVVARPRAVGDPTRVAPGALVAVVGQVFGSRGHLQVFAEDVGGVTVIGAAPTNRLPLEFVARNAARIEGHRVVVRALLADIRAVIDPRHAFLRDGPASLWAFHPDGWTAGLANVTGRLLVTSRGRCELFAAPAPDAVETTLAALAGCPVTLLGTSVRVRGVVVEPGEFLGTGLTVRDGGDGVEVRVAAFVRGWDWRRDVDRLAPGSLVTLEGIVEYHVPEARWQIVGTTPLRR